MSPTPKFSLGRIVGSPAALKVLEDAGTSAWPYIHRHQLGDWGDDMTASDRKANDNAVIYGDRILSSYALSEAQTLWIITDAADDNGHRLATTVLLPGDY